MKIEKFTFNPFAENTYVVSDNGIAAIFDPGMHNVEEEKEIQEYLNEEKLDLQFLINTHCHIDHILGNQYVADRFKLKLKASEKESLTLSWAAQSAAMWSVPFKGSPEIEEFLKEDETLQIGDSKWEILEVSGHAVGHLVFYNDANKVLIGGDTLFFESIGRTDLPGGNHQDLISNIHAKLMVLPDEVSVYSGHGPETTIGHERENNPFL